MFRRFPIGLFLSLCLMGAPLWAQWQSLGPFGGDVRSLVQDPQTPQRFYLGTVDSQIFASDDGGAHWARLSSVAPQSDLVVDHLVIDPRDSKRLYAGVWSILSAAEGGVYFSSDRGVTWKELPGMRGQSVRALAMAPSDSKALVAGTLDGVFETVDAGQTWRQISPVGSAEIRNVESIAIDPRDPKVIYAGTWHLPWKTVNGGQSWLSIHRGIVTDSDVFAIFVHSSLPDSVLLSACTGIYTSSNGGELWNKFKGIPSSSRRTRAIAAPPGNPNTIFAGTTEGLWRSLDAGANWQLISSRTLTVNAIVIDKRDPSRIYLGTDDAGVLVSNDNGQFFRASNDGFTSRAISSVLFDHASPQRIFVSVLYDHANGGVFRSDDGGRTWKQQIDGLESTDVHTLFQSPDDGSIWAGTTDGAFVLDPSTRRWKRADLLVETPPRYASRARQAMARSGSRSRVPAVAAAMTISKGLGSVMSFSGEPAYGHYFFAASQRGLFVSRDTGTKWKKIETPDDEAPGSSVLALPDGRVFYGTSDGLLISRDEGSHWTPATLDDGPTPIHRIVAVPGKGNIILVATGRGLYRSLDGGLSWMLAKGGMPKSDISDIRIDAHAGVQIYATESFYGSAYRSTDLGATWQWINPFPESGLKYSSVLVDPGSPDRCYALFFREGLYTFNASALAGPRGAQSVEGRVSANGQERIH